MKGSTDLNHPACDSRKGKSKKGRVRACSSIFSKRKRGGGNKSLVEGMGEDNQIKKGKLSLAFHHLREEKDR